MADIHKRAVALKYDPKSQDAPKVVAKGRGVVAEQILSLARKQNVPVREDVALVQVLSQVKLDQEIPPQLYQAVAAIISALYRVNRHRSV